MKIKDWLTERIAEESGKQIHTINCDEVFESFNLDSLSSISIMYELEKEFKLDELNPSVFTEYNTINKLSEWIENRM